MVQVQHVFGLRAKKIGLFEDPNLTKEIQGNDLAKLSGKIIYVAPVVSNGSSASRSGFTSPVCHFANIEFEGKKGTLLLENPRGSYCSAQELLDQVGYLFLRLNFHCFYLFL